MKRNDEQNEEKRNYGLVDEKVELKKAQEAFDNQDYETAIGIWERLATDLCNADAMYAYGACYFSGIVVAQNYTEAVKWYRKSADKGNVDAIRELGLCYGCGYGVNQDYTQAIRLFSKAVDMGDDVAMVNLGYCYQTGEGVTQDYAEAIRLYSKAADLGNCDAMYNLGLSYFKGIGVEQNYKDAVKWYRKAANLGYDGAMSDLGYCYAEGYGLSQDNSKAVEWYMKAIDLGNVLAMANLAVLRYNMGKYDEAKEWAQKALDNGYLDEDGKIEEIMKVQTLGGTDCCKISNIDTIIQSNKKMNEQNLQNGNSADGADNNTSNHKVTIWELIVNIAAFALIDWLYEGDFVWWFFIVGVVISILLSWMFDAEKYEGYKLIIPLVIAFIGCFFQGILPLWTWLFIWPIIYSISVLIFSAALAHETHCKGCGKDYAMEVFNTEFLRSEQIWKRCKGFTKSGTEYEYNAPFTKSYYRDHRKCKFCGYEDYVDHYSEKQNKE